MGQLLVRRFDEELKTRLKRRAAQNGVSMEQEARTILRSALFEEDEELGLGTRIATLFRDIEWTDEMLEPFPSSEMKPANFD